MANPRQSATPQEAPMERVAVIGAGPAGMMAALTAARGGARVTLFERQDQPGVKLLATGGGRCNLTNVLGADEMAARFGPRRMFVRPALRAFDSAALRRFFDSLGVPTHCADGFHYFPRSESAADVRRALLAALEAARVTLRVGVTVTQLMDVDGAVRGVETDRGPAPADRVILATGGVGYPRLGSGDSGYLLAWQYCHSIIGPLPALVPLETQDEWPRRRAGVVIEGARAWIDSAGKPEICRGALLFTHRGLSGPAILDLSGRVAECLAGGTAARLRLGLTATERDAAAWSAEIARWPTAHGRQQIRTIVAREMPAALADDVCGLAGIATDERPATLSRERRRTLAEMLAGTPVTVAATAGFDQAMVTRGGVAVEEVDARTMRSRRVAGLGFAGEALDVDGPCGGYNLQWAFASGRMAGKAAGR